ncbi:hypothetical protein [Olsenella sp. Marseille-P4559]|uniref:hypothetical protein n=1 Tax=Olsenella sp. Marseille-P4559 TaxID=2364795 RepID=UPI001030116A|nr:hypothetical protein [Olsenella sp. Marseille-P4559]
MLSNTAHGDRGWHHGTPGWIRQCEGPGVVRPMPRRGHSPDDAVSEAFFGRLKVGSSCGRDWRGHAVEGFVEEPRSHIAWHDEGRPEEFHGDGHRRFGTIAGRRKRLGIAA